MFLYQYITRENELRDVEKRKQSESNVGHYESRLSDDGK